MTLKKSVTFLFAFLLIAGFGAGAFAQIVDEDNPDVANDKKTTTTITQEVQTTLPVNPIGEKVEEIEAPKQENLEAKKLAMITEEMTVCVEMKDRVMRLRCYDDLATDIGIMKEEFKTLERQKLASYGFWQVTSEVDQMGIETMYLSMTPVNKMASLNLQSKVPTFSIRCRQGNTDVYVDMRAPMNNGKPMLKDIFIFGRVDSEPEFRETWAFSMDAFAAFAPDPIGYIKQMRGKRKMQIRITPYGGVTETLMFEIGLLEPALDIMVKRCYSSGNAQQAPAPSNKEMQGVTAQ